MKMMRLVLVVVMAIMLAFTSAQAEFFAGIHAGPNFPTTSGAEWTAFNTTFSPGNLTPNTGFLIGGQFGYDFLRETEGRQAWTQFITLAIDFTINSYSLPRKSFTYQSGNTTIYNSIEFNGFQAAWTFLFSGKIPLMKSEAFRTGRLFPYVGLGPSLVLTVLDYDKTSFNLGLVVEPGVRFMFTRNLSGDLAYRFLYTYASFNDVGNNVEKISWNVLNHALVFRFNFHF